MAECNATQLLASAGCFNCLTEGQRETAMLSLLCQILQALDPMATCDAKALIADGCFNCLTAGQRAVAGMQLMCDILDALGGGVGDGRVLLFNPTDGLYYELQALGVPPAVTTNLSQTGE